MKALRLNKDELTSFKPDINPDIQPTKMLFTIKAGAGGLEALDWAEALLRMYLRWFERQSVSAEVLDIQREPQGVRYAELLLPYSKSLLGERGLHRRTRVSPFSKQKKIHTTFCLVQAEPVVEQVKFELKEADLSEEFIRSGGHGGQNVNKVSTCVRLVHNPTRVSVKCSMTRYQAKNRELARSILQAKVKALLLTGARDTSQQITMGFGGERTRSYIHGDRVVDHKTGRSTHEIDRVLSGRLDLLHVIC